MSDIDWPPGTIIGGPARRGFPVDDTMFEDRDFEWVVAALRQREVQRV